MKKKECPFCSKEFREERRRCPYCNSWVEEVTENDVRMQTLGVSIKAADYFNKDQVKRLKSLQIETKLFSDRDAEKIIQSRRRVLIKYEDGNGEISERKIDIYYSKFGYFWGWCHLRNAPRTFKLDGVINWDILNEKFDWNETTADLIRHKALENETNNKPSGNTDKIAYDINILGSIIFGAIVGITAGSMLGSSWGWIAGIVTAIIITLNSIKPKRKN